MSDYRTSILIKNQLPEFVREEHPKFIDFLEAYYEFLDKSLLNKAKDFRNLADVDISLNEFEKNFFNTYLNFVPRDAAVRKDILIKNINSLYNSKGTEKSYKLLFRMLFDEEVDVEYPRNQILRASDGRWLSENILRLSLDVHSSYISNGSKKIYYLPYLMNADSFELYVDGVLQTINVNYFLQKEYKKIVFSTSPNENSIIKIVYNDFDISVLSNRQINGLVSGAKALIEKAALKNIFGLNYYELFINNKTLEGNFINGELLSSSLMGDEEIPFVLECFSDLEKINVIDGGSSYNVGDPVIIKGTFTKPAVAVVSNVASGVIDSLGVIDGGAGFQITNNIQSVGYSIDSFNALVQTIDGTGLKTANTLVFNTDIISNYASVSIGAANYGFPSSVVPSENVNTIIADALTSNTLNNFGSITSVSVINSFISSDLNPDFKVNIPDLVPGLKVTNLNSIGKIKIVSPGTGYQIGDWLTFTNQPPYFSGRGANAYVSSVSANGGIKSVTIKNGGLSYSLGGQPLITVSSTGGLGANLQIEYFMGSGEDFENLTANVVRGKIYSISILDSGKGFISTPTIDLTGFGDGNAVANASIRNSYVNLPGRWTTSDSLLSDDSIRMQGRNYYIDFSYVLSSKVEFAKYKNILKNLIHPSGLVNYAKYAIESNIGVKTPEDVDSYISYVIKVIDPLVNVTAGSVQVDGNNTVFLDMNTKGTLIEGTYISVNSEVRIVNSIVSNTVLTTSEPFTFSANNQKLKIIVVGYNSITTQQWIEIQTENENILITE